LLDRLGLGDVACDHEPAGSCLRDKITKRSRVAIDEVEMNVGGPGEPAFFHVVTTLATGDGSMTSSCRSP